MKKIISSLFVVLSCFVCTLNAEIFTSVKIIDSYPDYRDVYIKFRLDTSSRTAEVIYMSGYANNGRYDPIIIPPEVFYDNKFCRVTRINSNAFSDSCDPNDGYEDLCDDKGHTGYYADDLTSITIPESVIEIGISAFKNCKSLKKMILPNSLKHIADNTFFGCDSLKEVSFPDSLESIGRSAFLDCGSLREVILPNSLKSMGNAAFYDCNGLKKITLPNSLKHIADKAFGYCENLKEITFPDSLESIGDNAFYGCSSLMKIYIPQSVTNIGDNAFSYNKALVSITVDSDNPVYDSRNDCNAIIHTATNTLIQGCASTVIPESVTKIGEEAFFYCDSLKKITIPNAVGSISTQAFLGCSNLTDITFSDSLKYIGWLAFYKCEKLTTIILPDSLKDIGSEAFSHCIKLETITLPDSLKDIGSEAFYNCNLKTIFYNNPNPQSYKYDIFTDYENATLYVPCGTSDIYRSRTPWYKFKNIVEFNHSFIVSADDPAHGTVEILEELACDNENYTLKATPAADYMFVQWSDGVTNNPRQVTVTQDTAFTAEFAPLLYTLTALPNDDSMGTISGNSNGEYKPNSVVKIEAVANEGFYFMHWNDYNTSNPRYITLTQDTTITAEFAPLLKLTVLSDDESMGTVSGSGEYKPNSTVEIEAQANEGFRFLHWNDDITDNPRQVTLTQDSTFTAYFEPLDTEVSEISDDGFDVSVKDRTISVHNSHGLEIQVIDITGYTIYTGYDTTITLRTPGVYIVRCGNLTKKTVVK